ncbi:hypothetical protein YC2023_101704 [Brassica napus]
MQLGVVQSSLFFVDSSSHHVNQVGYSVIYLIIIQEEFRLKHGLWQMTVFFPLNLLLLGFCFDVNVGKLGVMLTTSFRFSYDDLMEIGVWRCASHINILWFFRWVRPPSYLCGLVMMGIVDLSGAIFTTGAFVKKVIIQEYLQLWVVTLPDILEAAPESDPKTPNRNPNRSSKISERILNRKYWISEPERVISEPEWISKDNRTYFKNTRTGSTPIYRNTQPEPERPPLISTAHSEQDFSPAPATSIGWNKMSVRVIKHQLRQLAGTR